MQLLKHRAVFTALLWVWPQAVLHTAYLSVAVPHGLDASVKIVAW